MTWDEMRKLEKDWDSYGADPPTELAIENARAFCEILGSPHCLSKGTWYHVAPSVEDGVGVTLGHAPGEFYIEFSNDGEITAIRLKKVENK